MAISSLAEYVRISPNKNAPRNQKVSKGTIHHMAANLTIEACGALFASPSRKASATYGIGSDGRIGCYVDENDRPWTSSSAANDNRAITIEVANCQIGGDWAVSDAAMMSLINLLTDICRRHGFQLTYDGTPNGSLTRHNMFAATTCPGKYLQDRFSWIAEQVNARLDGAVPPPAPATPTPAPAGRTATVKTNGSPLNIRAQTNTWSKVLGSIPNGSRVDITSESAHWVGVNYNGTRGYCAKQWINLGATPAPTPAPAPGGGYVVGGTYTVTTPSGVKIRSGAGTNYGASGYVTASGKAQSSYAGGFYVYRKGTRVTCNAVATDGAGNTWIKTPSGWIAAKYQGSTYVA